MLAGLTAPEQSAAFRTLQSIIHSLQNTNDNA
jgi:hypothetical protein